MGESVSKNIERIEERVTGSDYEAMQHFVSTSSWDHRPLLNQLAMDADAILGGDINTSLIIDETCFAKQGKNSVGVHRQWNGNLGKIDNCQCGVFASLTRGHRSTLIDFDLYLPQEWIEDPSRCAKAKIPQQNQVFQTKIDIAVALVDRAISNRVRFSWVGADSFYGHNHQFRQSLQQRGLNYVCDVKKSQKVQPLINGEAQEAISVEDLCLREFSEQSQRVSYRQGTKGMLSCQACVLEVHVQGVALQLVISYDKKGGHKYSLTNMAGTLNEHVYRQRQRYWVEDDFKRSKSNVGMADYQVRGWVGWYHHMTLVCLGKFFICQQQLEHQDEVPLLSARDIVTLLEFYLPSRAATEDEIFEQMLIRHHKRLRDIGRNYLLQGIPIDDRYLPK